VQHERDLAVAARRQAEDEKARAEDEKAEADWQMERGRHLLMGTQMLQVTGVYERDPGLGLRLLEDADVCPPDLRDFVWGYYYRLCKRERARLYGHVNQAPIVALSGDGSVLVSAGFDRTPKVWDLPSGQLRHDLKGHTQHPTAVALTRDGRVAATAAPREGVRLWDVVAGAPLQPLRAPTRDVFCVAFSPDGRTLATGGEFGVVRLWDVATGEERAAAQGSLAAVKCVAFAPDGATLAAGAWTARCTSGRRTG
jgi:WD40 repeat protein